MSRNSTRATTWPRARDECRYERPSSSRVNHAAPSAPTTCTRSTMSAQSRPYAPAFMRTPPPAVPGIAHANSIPPRPAALARCRLTAFGAPPPAVELCALDLDRGQLAGQSEHEAVHARVRSEHVRSEPDDEHGQRRLARPREQALEVSQPLGSSEVASRAADADGRQPRERDVPLEPGGNCLWMIRHSSGSLASPTRMSFAATLTSGAGRGSAPGEEN